jgi:hypothetical protein
MTLYKIINNQRIELTAEEVAERQAEEQAWNDGAFDRAMEDLRAKRNNLLKDTDHLALSDQTLSDDMRTYRQSLRDITNGLTTVEQVEAVTWPTKPGA